MDIQINPLPDKPILGFSNSAANKDMMSKIWTNGIQFLLFPQCFQKLSVVMRQNEYLWTEGLIAFVEIFLREKKKERKFEE